MVWACFSWRGLGPLVILEGSVTGEIYARVIEQHVYPTMLAMFDNPSVCLFQDDNAAVHHTQAITDLKDSLDINSLSWPSQSPDLNPIKNL
jgi:hypothetical protein